MISKALLRVLVICHKFAVIGSYILAPFSLWYEAAGQSSVAGVTCDRSSLLLLQIVQLTRVNYRLDRHCMGDEDNIRIREDALKIDDHNSFQQIQKSMPSGKIDCKLWR